MIAALWLAAGLHPTPIPSTTPSPAPTVAPLADAALVLSGDVAFERVGAAVALFLEGRVRFLVLTGAGIGGDNARFLAERAQEAGVPWAAILLEERSRSTAENLDFAAPLLRVKELKRIALVTSDSHMPRALALARQRWPEFEWVPVAVPNKGPERRESFALIERLKLLLQRLLGWP